MHLPVCPRIPPLGILSMSEVSYLSNLDFMCLIPFEVIHIFFGVAPSQFGNKLN
jgi:hypothetical protein